MDILNDGTVIPSNLETGIKLPNAKDHLMNNMSLKSGMVIGMVYPDDEKSLSKQFIEYHVMVSQVNRNGVNLTVYRNCLLSNIFGAPNNSLVYTLVPGQSHESGLYVKGSRVMLLCINGIADAGSAVIIGGLTSEDVDAYSKNDGQFYDFNFNGINQNINKDGELTITFNSPIDVDGKKANEPAAGTQIKIDKDGRIKISDNEGQFWEIDRVGKTSTWGNGSESVKIDKTSKEISLSSGGAIQSESKADTKIKADGNMDINAKGGLNAKTDGNLSVEAQGGISEKTSGNWSVKAGGNVTVKGTMVTVQGETMATFKGLITMIGQNAALPCAVVGQSQVFIPVTSPPGTPSTGIILTGSNTVLIGS